MTSHRTGHLQQSTMQVITIKKTNNNQPTTYAIMWNQAVPQEKKVHSLHVQITQQKTSPK